MHYSVMKEEVLENLKIKETGIYVDATLGYAGHSKEILKRIKKGYLFAFDVDDEGAFYSREVLAKIGDNFKIIKANFCDLGEYLDKEKISLVDGFLFDLGLSSPEIDDASRGFSFMQDARLDMRINRDNAFSAKDVVNQYSKEELTNIFYKFGEEKRAKEIAKAIVDAREKKEITRTLELVEIIKSSVGANYFYKNHPEREIFQAIRIEVNKELDVIEKALPEAIKRLKKGGRMCVITFHSLEDRIVKNIFKKYSEVNEIFRGLPSNEIPEEYQPIIKIINKKPIVASSKELRENSRSKSAKLRVIERI